MKKIIVANWKMNPQTLSEARSLFGSIEKGNKDIKNVEIIVCPPFVFLPEIKNKDSKIKLGAQDCFEEEKGAFTGGISILMLKNLNCEYIILGHSERRRFCKESNLMVNKKIKSVLETGLKPILCVGETEEEKKEGQTIQLIQQQIEKGLNGVPKIKIKDIMVAYEPVWAIGTGKACKSVEAQVMSLLIKKIITKLYSRQVADNLPVLYGGSVNRENALCYLKEAGMAGLLIGGASLDPKEFNGIIKDIENFDFS